MIPRNPRGLSPFAALPLPPRGTPRPPATGSATSSPPGLRGAAGSACQFKVVAPLTTPDRPGPDLDSMAPRAPQPPPSDPDLDPGGPKTPPSLHPPPRPRPWRPQDPGSDPDSGGSKAPALTPTPAAFRYPP